MEIINRLLGINANGDKKSYLIGLERGRIWASEDADYFTMREWGQLNLREIEAVLPNNEETHFMILSSESPLEWESYVKGWIEGVKEIASRY
ncbi:hypothetical protein JXA56_03640 [Candidatus Micrarchaeota archaeon]|nr:hypothetical protein [Candidatus Micrarchaeota archaeon]